MTKNIDDTTQQVELPEGVKTRSTFTTGPIETVSPVADCEPDLARDTVADQVAGRITEEEAVHVMNDNRVSVAAAKVREEVERTLIDAGEVRERWEGATHESHMHAEAHVGKEASEPGAPTTRRQEIIDLADEAISGSRQVSYGPPAESFDRIAALWTARDKHIGDREYTAADVAQMMALVKISRLSQSSHHTDSWVDLAGYAAIGAEVAGA